ncbi:MAG: response regulator transcription factor [Ruminococcus sp.]|nr:response regulator transcription factor [Ruminococcus sp.]
MSHILIIEDDIPIRKELSQLLVNAGYETSAVTDFSEPLPQILSSPANLILLDINLPNVNGEMLLHEIRKERDTPVIMVTSRTNELDEVLSMSYGADDYITKPYNPTILLLRISAVLKRSSAPSKQLTYRGLTVDAAKGTLSGAGGELILTKNEMIIFRTLLDRQGQIVSRDQLMTALWDNEEYINDNALTVNISRLRAKLAEIGCAESIETRKKQGYVLL